MPTTKTKARTRATTEVKGGPVEHIRSELNKCKKRWGVLHEMANGAFSYKWLVAFANRKIEDPGFNKMLVLGRLLGVVIEARVGPHALRPHG